jgi:hypothetical protein
MKKPYAKQIIVGAMALTLLGGGGALAISQNAFAATNPTPTPTAAVTAQKGNHGVKEFRGVSDQLITFLKLDKTTFETKLATETLAQIATDQGISRDALKAELTSEFNAQQDKEKTDFAANLDATVDSNQIGKFGGRDGGPGGHGGKGHNAGARIDLASTAALLGYATAADLQTALVSGTSIADLAAAKGITVQSVIDLQAAQIIKDLDQKLADKTITQAQYDTKKADSTKIATNLVNDKHDQQGGRGGHGPGGHGPGGHGPGNDNNADDAAPTTAPTTTPTATPSIN